MKLYDNPLAAIAYLLGIGTKNAKNRLQDAIDKRDERKSLESAIEYLSADEEKRKQRAKIAEKREKIAMRCLFICLIGTPFGFILLLFSSPVTLILALIDICAVIAALLYGLWYSLSGKYV